MISSTIRSQRATILTLVALLVLSASPALAQRGDREFSRSGPKVLAAFREVVARPAQSLVRIQCNGKDAALGTIVSADGLILTKASQLNSKATCKLKDGRTFEAKVIGVEEPHDLALLKIDVKGLIAIEWKPSKDAVPGEWIASPGTETDPAGIGVIGVAARAVSPRSYPRTINSNGGYLGISGNPEEESEGVRVREVQKDTAAEKAGLKVDDLIIAIDGKKVRDIESLQQLLGKYRPNDPVTVRVKRGDDEVDLKATLGRRPPGSSRSDFQNSMGSELSAKRTGFPNILQHDTVLKPVDCGGPLVDLDGKAIGINIARAGRTESYAIPSDTVVRLLVDLKSGKLAPKEKPQPTAKEEKIADLELALRRAEQRLAVTEKKATTAQALLKQAEEARDTFGKDDPDIVESLRRVNQVVQRATRERDTARSAVEKLRDELKKARAMK